MVGKSGLHAWRSQLQVMEYDNYDIVPLAFCNAGSRYVYCTVQCTGVLVVGVTVLGLGYYFGAGKLYVSGAVASTSKRVNDSRGRCNCQHLILQFVATVVCENNNVLPWCWARQISAVAQVKEYIFVFWLLTASGGMQPMHFVVITLY